MAPQYRPSACTNHKHQMHTAHPNKVRGNHIHFIEIMVISYLFLFLAFNIDLGEGQNVCTDESRCGGHGPAIRFPFRLDTQPEHCGYPGFILSCTDTRHTVLELPISVRLFVKKIDYNSQVIQLYDPDHCFQRQLRGLNLSSSPFQYQVDSPYNFLDYAIFKCSPRQEMDYQYILIPCLSGPTYQVYAVYSNTVVTDTLIYCTKMYSLRSFPVGIILHPGNTPRSYLEFKWSTPDCKHCEVMKGKRCVKSNRSGTGTECISFSKHTKGILPSLSFYPINCTTPLGQYDQIIYSFKCTILRT